GRPIRLLFSGDLGPAGKPFQSEPQAPEQFDFVICESTYGGVDRAPNSLESRRRLLEDEVLAAAARGGAGPSGADGAGAWRGVPILLGGRGVGCRQDRMLSPYSQCVAQEGR